MPRGALKKTLVKTELYLSWADELETGMGVAGSGMVVQFIISALESGSVLFKYSKLKNADNFSCNYHEIAGQNLFGQPLQHCR